MSDANLEQVERTRHPCASCCQETNHEILGSKNVKSHDPDYNYEEKYMIVRCLGCNKLSFRKESHDYESYQQVGRNQWEYDITTEVYPPYLEGRHETKNLYAVPLNVRKIYSQTIDSMKQGNYIIAGIGLRATVESVCNDLSVQGGNLSTRINRLASSGAISRSDARNLQGIRFMGNDAAHEIIEPPKEAIFVALTIIEHLLETQYILVEQAGRYLVLPIDDFDTFVEMIKTKLWKTDENSAFTIRSLVGKDIRRINDFASYELKLETMVEGGEFEFLETANVPQEQPQEKRYYKRTTVRPESPF